MDEELKKKENTELNDNEMEDVSGGRGRDFDIEACPNCSTPVTVWRKIVGSNGSYWGTRKGTCENCGYVIEGY